MLSNKVTFGVIALVGLVGVAGAGAWFASRGTAPAGKPPAAAVTTPPSTIPAVGGAVEATEAVMDDKEAASAAGFDHRYGGQGYRGQAGGQARAPLSPDPSRGPPIGPSRQQRRRRRRAQSSPRDDQHAAEHGPTTGAAAGAIDRAGRCASGRYRRAH